MPNLARFEREKTVIFVNQFSRVTEVPTNYVTHLDMI